MPVENPRYRKVVELRKGSRAQPIPLKKHKGTKKNKKSDAIRESRESC